MDITSLQNQPGAGTRQSGQSSRSSLGKEEFLQLLVAQLRNQDPINPMDSKEFASQLAQFNSVEQLINLNEGMQSLAQNQQITGNGLNNTMAASLTGQSLRALSDQIAVSRKNKRCTV